MESGKSAVSEATTARERSNANLRPFQKGQSGNPSGGVKIKKVHDVTSLARDNGEKALKKLIQLIDSVDDRVALAAASAVLDRAMGKPKQALDVNKKQNASDYTESELLAIARMGGQGAH